MLFKWFAWEKNISEEEATEEVRKVLMTGMAYEKFKEWIQIQHGDLGKLTVSSKIVSIKSKQNGVISHIDTERLGELTRQLGAGRYTKEDVIDPTVGIKIEKKIGEFVISDEELAKVYVGEKDINVNDILECFTISEHFLDNEPLILDIIKD